jgi:hypothetical protein
MEERDGIEPLTFQPLLVSNQFEEPTSARSVICLESLYA